MCSEFDADVTAIVYVSIKSTIIYVIWNKYKISAYMNKSLFHTFKFKICTYSNHLVISGVRMDCSKYSQSDTECSIRQRSVASFSQEVNLRLVKRRLVFNGRLANHGLTSLVKEATEVWP